MLLPPDIMRTTVHTIGTDVHTAAARSDGCVTEPAVARWWRGASGRPSAGRMPVLGTKLHLPAPRRRLVQRTRLTDQLQAHEGEGPRLVLGAAPAGFGKTTLMTQWLAAAGPARRKVAWLALDPGDSDLRLFL